MTTYKLYYAMIKNVTFGEQNTILLIILHFKKWESKEPSIFLLEQVF